MMMKRRSEKDIYYGNITAKTTCDGDIRAQLVMKDAGLCSAQVSRLAQKRDGQLLDQSLLQQETHRNLAASITTVIGMCAPAADALRTKVSQFA